MNINDTVYTIHNNTIYKCIIREIEIGVLDFKYYLLYSTKKNVMLDEMKHEWEIYKSINEMLKANLGEDYDA